MGTFEAPNDYRNYLMHYGVKGMKWRNHRRSQMSKFGRLEERRNQDEANAAGQRHEDYLTERYISEQENKKQEKEQREQQMQEEQRRINEYNSGKKSSSQSLASNKKKLQSLINQAGLNPANEHRHINYENYRRRKKNH